VYYLDGQPTDKAVVDKLDPADLEKIEVFKGDRVAASIAGAQAEGLIVVTTKKNKDSAAVRALNEKIKKAEG
jgi:outer membrane receptor protein involved in Fe transport